MRLPDFVCVGPGRTGTTWLHAALSGHVGLPLRVKETRFWGLRYHKGIEWYAAHFRHCAEDLPVGEACPYFATPHARERIAEYIPNCKIIITLRDPVDRSYSQYRLLRKMGFARGSFEEELKHPRIATTNRYEHHLRGWLDLFGTRNVKVLLFDDLVNDPQSFLDQVCDFINIPNIPLASQKFGAHAINSCKYLPRSRRMARRTSSFQDFLYEHGAHRLSNFLQRMGFFDFCFYSRTPFPALSPASEHRLREALLPEIEAVEKLLGLDLRMWKEHSALVNRWLEGVAEEAATSSLPGLRETAAIILALIPFATGAVPDGLDLAAMRFRPTQINSILEDSDDDVDDGSVFVLT